MNTVFPAAGRPLLIGSLPLDSHETALEWIHGHTPEIPLWPQLPCFPQERMMHQFMEGVPVIEEDIPHDHIAFNTASEHFASEQLAFFEDYLAVTEEGADLLSSRFGISRERARGIYLLSDSVAAHPEIIGLKGQVTGPFTLLTSISDAQKRIGYYDPTVREIVVKAVALKGAWQARFLKKHALPVLIFIDEPALAGLGSSAFISISIQDITADLDEVVLAIHNEGALAGVHVCANTDWELLLTSTIDVLSFDAFGFFDRLAGHTIAVRSFLDRGSLLAWGIVPTGEAEEISRATADGLATLWEKQADALGRERGWLLARTLITPSCGTGSLSRDLAARVLELTRDTSRILRERYA